MHPQIMYEVHSYGCGDYLRNDLPISLSQTSHYLTNISADKDSMRKHKT